MSTFLKTTDLGLKSLLYTRFGSMLGIDSISSTDEENINRGVVQYPKGIALREIAEKRGADYLEFISFYKTGVGFDWNRNRSTLSRRGMWLATEGTTATHIKAVPISITYDVCWWSRDVEKIQECIESYALWTQQLPKILLYYGDYLIRPDLHFGDIVDESPVLEKYQVGTIYVWRAPITIDSWAFSGFTTPMFTKVRLTLYDNDNLSSYEEIVVDGSSQDTGLVSVLKMDRKQLYKIADIVHASKWIYVYDDRAVDFSAGDTIYILDSTDSDGVYIVVSATYSELSDTTKIVVSESINGSTGDGTVYKPKE